MRIPHYTRMHLPPDNEVPTLADLQKGGGWLWLVCNGCGHRQPVAIAPFVIRWGPAASSNLLRRNARCQCGRRGASTQARSWGGNEEGFEAWPVESDAETDGAPPMANHGEPA